MSKTAAADQPKLKHRCRCLRCGYDWKSAQVRPKTCAGCSSPHWDRPPRPGNYVRGKDHPKKRGANGHG